MTDKYEAAAEEDKVKAELIKRIKHHGTSRIIHPAMVQDVQVSPAGIGEESDWDFSTFSDGIYMHASLSNEYLHYDHDKMAKYLEQPGYSLVAVVAGEVYWRESESDFLPFKDLYVDGN